MVRHTCYAMLLTLLLSVTPPVVRGDDQESVLMPLEVSQEESQSVTSGRSPRPISKIAENVTVITSDEIARLNAHSLSDILQTVPGLRIENYQTPGNFTFFNIQGQSDVYATILLLVDGISQGNLIQGTSDPGMIPVQHIERIEIIKGAASAAWGAALGGVVNVVTKSPDPDRPVGGSLSASYGEKKTSDLTAEFTGSGNGFGYYLSGGNLHSNGLLPNNGTNRNSLYGKLTYDLPAKGSLSGGISYVETSRGLVEIYDRDFDYIEHDDSSDRRYHSFLTLTYPLQPELSLEVTGHDSTIHGRSSWGERTDVVSYYRDYITDQRNSGGKVKVIWGDSLHNLTTGMEYQHSSIGNKDRLNLEAADTLKRRRDSVSAYANGTFTLGRLTLLPGVRYDKTGLDEDTTNYTAGATYRLGESTLLRGYWATGYGLPNAFLKSIPARVRTFQAGIETEAIPYLWLKGTYFYNHIWHIQDFWGDPDTFYTNDFNGFEVELKTVPVAGVSFKGGYTFTDAKDKDSDQTIKGVPRHLAKLAVSYADPDRGTDLLLSGNYAWLNMDYWGDSDHSWSHRPHYNPIIWNLHLNQKLLPGSELSPELFFNINNVFNGSQYWDYWYKNAGRWIEGGVRFRF